MKKTIGILYLCTGAYRVFWPDFRASFEANFLPDTEKRYYVLTDRPEEITGERVRSFHIDPLPWPLITLLRFHYFLRVQEELRVNDFLMFANSNLRCLRTVREEEFLPDPEEGLAVVRHPGHYKRKLRYCPYERRRESTAYIPYNCGKVYVAGGIYCGHAASFLRMSEILSRRIDKDLARRIIACWDDESQLNRYVLENEHVRVLSPSYCYLEGWDLPFEQKIVARQKQDYFDVWGFKGEERPRGWSWVRDQLRRRWEGSKRRKDLCWLRDLLLARHP